VQQIEGIKHNGVLWVSGAMLQSLKRGMPFRIYREDFSIDHSGLCIQPQESAGELTV
jgi:hypothetical protein